MEKKYYREDVIIEFNPITDMWEMYEKDTGQFIAEASRLVTLINEFDCLK